MSLAALRIAPALGTALRLGLVLALTHAHAACNGPGAEMPDEDTSTGGSSTGVWAEAPAPADVCADALLVSHGRYYGNLRLAEPDPATGGVCGGGGPDTFLRVEIPVRADLRVDARGVGFTPRVSLAPDDCLGGREIACATDAPLELRDLVGGTVLRVSVGIDPAVFSDLKQKSAPDGAPDPLSFQLDLGLTRVLDAGEVCEPASRGRCVAGTRCEAGEPDDAPVCTTLPADTCRTAARIPIVLDEAGEGALAIDPSQPQTDAHAHGCGGEGLRERVLRLALPAAPPGRALEIVAGRPDVGLALRTPTCLVADEVACAFGTTGPASVLLTRLASLQAAGVEPYLFVELPEGSELDPVFTLDLRLVPEPGPWSSTGAR